MRTLTLTVLILALAILMGCAKVPQSDIDAGKAAMAAAVQAEAELYAPEALKKAQDKAAALDAELAVQEGKFFKSYETAKQAAADLKLLSENAKEEAATGKQRAMDEANSAIAAAETSILDARTALAGAPKGKGSEADLAAMSADLDASALVLDEAKADLDSGKYLDAAQKAGSASEQAAKVMGDVQAAIEMMAAAKRR